MSAPFPVFLNTTCRLLLFSVAIAVDAMTNDEKIIAIATKIAVIFRVVAKFIRFLLSLQ